MNKNKIKKLMKITVICVFIIIILIILFRKVNNNLEKENENHVEVSDQGNNNDNLKQIEYKTEKVKNATSFYTVQKYINVYLDTVNNSKAQDIYNLLSNDYIENNKITIENLNNYIKKDIKKVKVQKMIYIGGNNSEKYMANVIDTSSQKEYYFIMNIDTANFTYSIEPIQNKNFQNFEEVELKNDIENIPIKGNNIFEYVRYSDEDMALEYIKYYNELLKDNVEKAYSLLDQEYKNNKFPTIEKFKEYASEKKVENDLNISEFSYTKEDNYQKYTIKDNYGYYYLIKETAIMEFSVQLDLYTIKNDEYDEKYSKLNDSAKVQANIKMFLTMLDNNDYEGAYSKLDSTFKKDNFATISEFEKYVTKNFYDTNYWTPKTSKTEGNLFIVEGILQDSITVAANNRKISFIVRLDEGTNYTMSFNFK